MAYILTIGAPYRVECMWLLRDASKKARHLEDSLAHECECLDLVRDIQELQEILETVQSILLDGYLRICLRALIRDENCLSHAGYLIEIGELFRLWNSADLAASDPLLWVGNPLSGD